MNILTDCVRCDREYGQLLKSILSAKDSARNPLPILITGLCDGATDATYVALAEEIGKLVATLRGVFGI